MAVISRGQITIVDLSDGKSINLYLGSNVATTQIFNKENSSYVPNWTVSPFLVITPEVYVTGVATNQVNRLKGVPTWQKLGSGTWTTIPSANAERITGYTTNEITIPESAVLNFESFKCEIKDTDAASGTYNTSVSYIISFADMSDPYQVEITTPQGTTLTSGLTSTTLTVQCWQNGALLADSFFIGATCKWRKFNKLGVQDTTWGTAGIKTGRSITVTRDEVTVAATFTVEIEK